MKATLRDGTEVLIRPIEAGDKDLLQQGLRHLSDDSIRARFLVPRTKLTSSELRYLTEVDGHDHVALVAVKADDPGRLAGVARFVRLADRPDTAEFAIVVGDPWQRQGLGGILAERLTAEARRQDVTHFTATLLSDNVAVRRLIARISQHLEWAPAANGVSEVTVDLAA